MNAINHTCQGESHKATNKVCQDYSLAYVTEEMSIAIVCDGHGGTRYFRSDVGAKCATEVAKKCIETFIKDVDANIFKNVSGIGVALKTEIQQNDFAKESAIDKLFRQLFASIIYYWREQILDHSKSAPLTELECSLNASWSEAFERGDELEKVYGCTLMCFAQTPNYWFAFHIGDGKCIAFDDTGNWSEPIPWDERCFLNKTTSLCDSSAIDEFRYCYNGNGTFPMSVFLGSDGIDDSFGETENMVNFYIQILKEIVNTSHETAQSSIEETLPQLSKIGSQDDMSIACLYNDELLRSNVINLIHWQRQNVLSQIEKCNQRIVDLKAKKAKYEASGITNQKDAIEFDYSKKELIRAFEVKRSLVVKINRLIKEISPEEFAEYSDEIGLYEFPEENITNETT